MNQSFSENPNFTDYQSNNEEHVTKFSEISAGNQTSYELFCVKCHRISEISLVEMTIFGNDNRQPMNHITTDGSRQSWRHTAIMQMNRLIFPTFLTRRRIREEDVHPSTCLFTSRLAPNNGRHLDRLFPADEFLYQRPKASGKRWWMTALVSLDSNGTWPMETLSA